MDLQDGQPRKRLFKDAVYRAVADVPAALANPHRLELLDLLSQRPRSVQDVAGEAGLTVANASQHLRVLERAGLVVVERRGIFAHYRVRSVAVYRLLNQLRAVAETVDARIANAETSYLGLRESGVATLEDAQRLIADDLIALLDVRPREEYESAHIPGAISAPLELLREPEYSLDGARQYVVYCRGAFCVFADEAVALLRSRGLEATRLALSPADWLAAGGEVERAG
jgi:rhodanese-related sulfurtransferase